VVFILISLYFQFLAKKKKKKEKERASLFSDCVFKKFSPETIWKLRKNGLEAAIPYNKAGFKT
jgi:hypothetical protein